jgi:hypothetical protein
MNAEQRQRASQLVRSQTEEEAIGEAFALLQELVDEQEPKPVAWIIQNRLTQACYVYATEQPADPNHIQVPVYTAPPAPEPEPSVPDGLIQNLVQTAMRGLLTDDDMANLRRFDECCQDSDADGHAVAKPKMKRLELAGVVRSCGFGRHETTAFGDWLLADAPEQPTSVPVLTVECEPDYWSGGHYYEGTKPHIAPTAVWKLPIGTKLYTSPPANNQSEQHLEMVNAPAPSVPDEQLQAAFDRGLKAGNEQAIAQQIEIHKLHDFLAVQQPAQPAELVRDAERYRWLRAYNTAKHPSVTEAFFLGDENLDAEIDAAIATEKGNKND